MRFLKIATLALAVSSLVSVSPSQTASTLMPQPRQAILGAGELAVAKGFSLRVDADAADEITRSAVNRCRISIEKAAGFPIPIQYASASSKYSSPSLLVVVHHVSQLNIGGDESYSLSITPEGAKLEAEHSIGAVRGMATVRQLVEARKQRAVFPVVSIKDAPLYPWRGLMIDSARHFIPLDVLMRNLDAMELVKMNVLHLHLSDNEGFRIESRVFPELQNKGSDGQYYTQDQMRGLIRYAELRGIMVVPEFDMPSHSKSWFAGYPELSSSPGPFKPGVLTYEGITARSDTGEIERALATGKVPAFDPTRETTYEFLDKFLEEMSALFPAPYLHIGADENNGAVWLANPSIVAFMQSHQLADAPALQAYFVARVQQLVASHGKRMVAWEEAYAPDKFQNSIFQVWSPWARTDLLRTPMQNGNQVLVSKGFYLDLFFPAYVHYRNDALPAGGPDDTGGPLLGGEAAMWTELEDANTIEARIWPRAGAIAERLWSPTEEPDLTQMYSRLFQLSALLDREGVHNLADYEMQTQRLAGSLPIEPVRTLLGVLTPLKGYRLHKARAALFGGAPDDGPSRLTGVADAVLVDSAAKYEFRNSLADWLKTHSPESGKTLRAWLLLWSRNDATLQPYWAQSADLAAVQGHSKSLAALATAALGALDQLQRGEPLSAGTLQQDDALLQAAASTDGGTEIAVLPEISGLIHGSLAPEPTSYPLF